MSYEYKLKLILLANHILLVMGLMYADLNWLALSFVGWIMFGKIGGEVTLHRFLAHKSFSTSHWKSRILIVLTMFNCFGSPIAWCGIHRKHHAVPDTENDPHGGQAGWRVWSTFWKPFTVERKYVIDLVKDKWIKIIHSHYLKILFTTYIALVLIDWRIAVFLISIPAVITFHSAGAVNTLCHKWGYRLFNTSDKSTNNTWVNILTLGSGLHNTHHAKPSDWNNKEKWWEIDFPGWVIKHFLKI
jgi:stearoyl-CoA desaturase (delta-9 desaturase)